MISTPPPQPYAPGSPASKFPTQAPTENPLSVKDVIKSIILIALFLITVFTIDVWYLDCLENKILFSSGLPPLYSSTADIESTGLVRAINGVHTVTETVSVRVPVYTATTTTMRTGIQRPFVGFTVTARTQTETVTEWASATMFASAPTASTSSVSSITVVPETPSALGKAYTGSPTSLLANNAACLAAAASSLAKHASSIATNASEMATSAKDSTRGAEELAAKQAAKTVPRDPHTNPNLLKGMLYYLAIFYLVFMSLVGAVAFVSLLIEAMISKTGSGWIEKEGANDKGRCDQNLDENVGKREEEGRPVEKGKNMEKDDEEADGWEDIAPM